MPKETPSTAGASHKETSSRRQTDANGHPIHRVPPGLSQHRGAHLRVSADRRSRGSVRIPVPPPTGGGTHNGASRGAGGILQTNTDPPASSLALLRVPPSFGRGDRAGTHLSACPLRTTRTHRFNDPMKASRRFVEDLSQIACEFSVPFSSRRRATLIEHERGVIASTRGPLSGPPRTSSQPSSERPARPSLWSPWSGIALSS